ncbi:hypothetical protein [Celeribacter sp.]|uniref:hypothetical protein n=1 Tax=Celeribacter sp. TaxID=1890673 RepID=UPI003A91938F
MNFSLGLSPVTAIYQGANRVWHWPEGAYSWAAAWANFARGQFFENGTGVAFTDLFTFTRASTATYFDADGVLQTAAVDELRFDHDPATGEPLGILIESSATRLNTYPVAGEQWSSSGTKTILSDNLFGVFNGVTVASAGAAYHRLDNPAISVTAGQEFYVRCLWKQGTSAYVRLNARNNTTDKQTTYSGPVAGTKDVSGQGAAATLELLEEKLIGDVFEWVFKATITDDGYFSFGIGPDVATVGKTCIVYGLQVTDTLSSWILSGPSASTTRASDNLSIPSTKVNDVLGGSMPDAVSLYMRGDVTYADTNEYTSAVLLNWGSALKQIQLKVDTYGSNVGSVLYRIVTASGSIYPGVPNGLQPGVNVPIASAGRCTATVASAALNGEEGTIVTSKGVPDTHDAALFFGTQGAAHIKQFALFSKDIGDEKLVEITS